MPPDKLHAFRRYVRGMLGLALRSMIVQPGQPKVPVVFLLDEFAQLGHFTPVEDGVSMLRGYGAWLWLLVQDLSQLQNVYPKWRTFLANMTLQAFGTQDFDTAKYISNMLGQTTIEVESASATHNLSERLGANASTGRSTSIQATGRSLLLPDEIRRLNNREVIVLEQGRDPARLVRLNYLGDPEVAGLWEKNPMYDRSAAS